MKARTKRNLLFIFGLLLIIVAPLLLIVSHFLDRKLLTFEQYLLLLVVFSGLVSMYLGRERADK